MAVTTRNQRLANEEAQPTRLFGSSRLALCLVFMVGFALAYAMRVDMSVAILCMVNHTAVSETEANSSSKALGNATAISNSIDPKCIRNLLQNGTNPLLSSEDGPFVWDAFIQNQILAAFFIGYPIFQIPGGFLASSFGGRWVLFSCILGLSLSTFLLPFVAESWVVVAGFRVLQGLASGAIFPSSHAIIGHWAPPVERTIITSIAYSGTQLGNVFAFPICGLLCRYFSWGWVFYFWGGMGMVWLVIWFFFGYNKPDDHPRINAAEKQYINGAIGDSAGKHKQLSLRAVPWCSFLKSPAVWAMFVGNFTSDWGAYTFLSQTPRYMKSVHNFDIASNAMLSAIPYVGYWLVITAAGYLADFVRKRNWMTTRWTRRMFAISGFMLPTILVVILGYISCEHWVLALMVLILIISLSGLQYSSWVVSSVDCAPKYAGILYGICNSLSSASGIMTNSIAGIFMSAQPTLEEWRLLFFITGGVMAFGCMFYCIFIRAEIQPWARDEEETNEDGPEEVPLTVIGNTTAQGVTEL